MNRSERETDSLNLFTIFRLNILTILTKSYIPKPTTGPFRDIYYLRWKFSFSSMLFPFPFLSIPSLFISLLWTFFLPFPTFFLYISFVLSRSNLCHIVILTLYIIGRVLWHWIVKIYGNKGIQFSVCEGKLVLSSHQWIGIYNFLRYCLSMFSSPSWTVIKSLFKQDLLTPT